MPSLSCVAISTCYRLRLAQTFDKRTHSITFLRCLCKWAYLSFLTTWQVGSQSKCPKLSSSNVRPCYDPACKRIEAFIGEDIDATALEEYKGWEILQQPFGEYIICHSCISKDERKLHTQHICIIRFIGKWVVAEQLSFLNTLFKNKISN